MTDTAKHENEQAQPEAPLAWTSKKEWGSVGNTHRATVKLDNGDQWSFVVDQPRKGYWAARGWLKDREDVAAGRTGSGYMFFYREHRTMKDAKAQCQAQANLAQTSTCDECRKIGGHKLDCGTGLSRWLLTRRATDEAGPDDIKPLPQRTPAPAIRQAAEAMGELGRSARAGHWRLLRPDGCHCPTPTHRMSCGAGGKVTVIPQGAFDAIPDHLYNERCDQACCGGAA